MIEAILEALGEKADEGDDVAVVPGGPGKLVVKSDMLVEKTDVPRGMTYRQAARKAVAACVSDFAAKGVKPRGFLASVGVPRGTTRGEASELGRGFRDAEEEWGAKMVGGDTNEAEQLVVDCSMFGFGKGVVGRGGAREGDVVVTTGAFGLPPAGLRILDGSARAAGEFKARAVGSVLRPAPDLRVGLALSRFLTCSMDSSDGLARSLHTLARASGVGFEVAGAPVAEGVGEFARRNGLDTNSLVFEGGEEYVIVGTVRERDLAAAGRAVRRAGGKLHEVGAAAGKAGEVVLRVGGRREAVRDAGWTHLGGG